MVISIPSAKTDFNTKRAIEAPLGAIGFDSCLTTVAGGFIIDADICSTVTAIGRMQDLKDILSENDVEFFYI